MTGEYIGKDGRTYRWSKSPLGFQHEKVGRGAGSPIMEIAPEDWPAARDALDALIEEGAGEWVEIPSLCNRPVWRIRVDGSEPQIHIFAQGGWQATNGPEGWVNAYRKGREVALEQVQELVKVVEEYADERWGGSAGPSPALRDRREHILAAAKAVKL